ncbi:MAG: hypothetical protein PHG85_07160 [Candidatus Altiarchaeota archaeon]|nr:hypothetical protein [Candidatus Altiarchaeota archaeon]
MVLFTLKSDVPHAGDSEHGRLRAIPDFFAGLPRALGWRNLKGRIWDAEFSDSGVCLEMLDGSSYLVGRDSVKKFDLKSKDMAPVKGRMGVKLRTIAQEFLAGRPNHTGIEVAVGREEFARIGLPEGLFHEGLKFRYRPFLAMWLERKDTMYPAHAVYAPGKYETAIDVLAGRLERMPAEDRVIVCPRSLPDNARAHEVLHDAFLNMPKPKRDEFLGLVGDAVKENWTFLARTSHDPSCFNMLDDIMQRTHISPAETGRGRLGFAYEAFAYMGAHKMGYPTENGMLEGRIPAHIAQWFEGMGIRRVKPINIVR